MQVNTEFNIDPNRLYTTRGLKNLIKGFVQIQTLRANGLVAMPGKGYWGQDVIDAINRMQHNRRRRPGASLETKGGEYNSETQPEKSNTHPPRYTLRDEAGSVAIQLQRFERLIQKGSTEGGNAGGSNSGGGKGESDTPEKRAVA